MKKRLHEWHGERAQWDWTKKFLRYEAKSESEYFKLNTICVLNESDEIDKSKAYSINVVSDAPTATITDVFN